ncbi:MAG: hypothetical protein ACJ75B_15770 [Flavisolibacter sp.]
MEDAKGFASLTEDFLNAKSAESARSETQREKVGIRFAHGGLWIVFLVRRVLFLFEVYSFVVVAEDGDSFFNWIVSSCEKCLLNRTTAVQVSDTSKAAGSTAAGFIKFFNLQTFKIL